MDFFTAFSLLLAIGFLVCTFVRQRIVDLAAFHRALFLFLAALACYYGVSMIFMVGVYLSIAAGPVGFVLGLMSFRALCLSLVAVPARAGAKF